MRHILIIAMLFLAACQFHVVVKPPTVPAHNPLAAPTISLLPTVTPNTGD